MADIKTATILVDRLVMKGEPADKFPMWKLKQEMPREEFNKLPRIEEKSEIRVLSGDWIVERKKQEA
jgi:hypothetical protein